MLGGPGCTIVWACVGIGGGICPPGAAHLGEACGIDVDCIACACAPTVYQPVACGETWCGTAWADGGVRDTEWFVLEVPDPDGDGVEMLSAVLVSEFPGVVIIVDGAALFSCQLELLATGCADAGAAIETATATVAAPAQYAVFVATGDCAANGIFDGYACGTANAYAVTFECAAVCIGDVNGSGDVGIADLLLLLAAWGPAPGNAADLDGDGIVGILDFLALLAAWGPC